MALPGIPFLATSALLVCAASAVYGTTEYWNDRYKEKGLTTYQWLQSEDSIREFILHFFRCCGDRLVYGGRGRSADVHRVVELGFGSSTMCHNVLYEGGRLVPEEGAGLAQLCAGDVAAESCLKDVSPSLTVLCVDYSEVAYTQMLELVRYNATRTPNLHYAQGDIYSVLYAIRDAQRGELHGAGPPPSPPPPPPPPPSSLPEGVAALSGGRRVLSDDTRPVDLYFDSGVFDTLIIANSTRAFTEATRLAFETLHPRHGVWISVSYSAPESRLDAFTTQPWGAIFICSASGSTNHLFALLRSAPDGRGGEMVVGPYRCRKHRGGARPSGQAGQEL